MNEFYAKTILYAYKNLETVICQLDELVLKKSISSMCDFSPCEKIAEKILALTAQKDILINLILKTDKAVSKFTDDEKLILDYKYFKRLPKQSYSELDFSSRSYFRKQVRVVVKFGSKISALGVDDAYFINKCLKIDFIRELYKRVLIREKNFAKMKEKCETLALAEKSA